MLDKLRNCGCCGMKIPDIKDEFYCPKCLLGGYCTPSGFHIEQDKYKRKIYKKYYKIYIQKLEEEHSKAGMFWGISESWMTNFYNNLIKELNVREIIRNSGDDRAYTRASLSRWQ